MSKVAFLFGGRITSYEQQKDYLLNLQKKYSADFFASLNTDILDTEHLNFIKDFNVKYCYERYDKSDDIQKLDFRNGAHSFDNACSMFYNNYKAFQLLEDYQCQSNFKYDIIVKFRADIVSKQELILIQDIKSNSIYIPNNYDWGGYNDQIAYGDFESMKSYCNLYNCFETIRKIDSMFHPETNLKTYLNYNKFNIERFGYEYNLNLNRNK